MKLNIVDVICSRIERLLELPFTVYSDLIPEAENDGACLRREPTPAYEKRFLDGSRLISWNLTFYVRCKDSDNAVFLLKSIIDSLDLKEIETDETKIFCEAVTLPQFIENDSKGFTVYSASIKCTYTEEF